jgi:hypothetical protein
VFEDFYAPNKISISGALVIYDSSNKGLIVYKERHIFEINYTPK